jgi:hypothetical protein
MGAAGQTAAVADRVLVAVGTRRPSRRLLLRMLLAGTDNPRTNTGPWSAWLQAALSPCADHVGARDPSTHPATPRVSWPGRASWRGNTEPLPRPECHSLTTYLRHIKKIAGLPLAEWLLTRHLVDGDCRQASDPHRGLIHIRNGKPVDMTSPLDSGNVGPLRQRFSPELLAFPSPDSDNRHEAASPKMALSPIRAPTRPKCPQTATLRASAR